MTASDRDWRDDYELGVAAFRMWNIDIESRLGDRPELQRVIAWLVRRRIAAGYDADDCVHADMHVAYRREVFALARALRGMASL